jgi:carbamate kinase
MTISEAKMHLADGQFAEGSMAPKIRAAISFVQGTGKDAIITSSDKLGIDNGGTRIVIV